MSEQCRWLLICSSIVLGHRLSLFHEVVMQYFGFLSHELWSEKVKTYAGSFLLARTHTHVLLVFPKDLHYFCFCIVVIMLRYTLLIMLCIMNWSSSWKWSWIGWFPAICSFLCSTPVVTYAASPTICPFEPSHVAAVAASITLASTSSVSVLVRVQTASAFLSYRLMPLFRGECWLKI